MEQSNQDRLLLLQRILFEETDEDHQLSILELIDKIRFHLPDMKLDPRTIRSDLETLERNGVDIIRNKGKFGKILYSYQSRLFETYQLRLLVDAILSGKFMDEVEKKSMIQRLKTLTSKPIAKTLPEPIPTIGQIGTVDYQRVQFAIDCIHRAISKKRILRYQYGRYNMDKEFVYSREGAIYEVEPYALIWKNDYYYLIARYLETDELRHYRLDRMMNVEMTDIQFRRETFDLNSYVDKSFHMFAGEEIRIKIEFDESLINVVLDRFGLDADIKKVNDELFVYKGKAKLSDGLINWILTWGNKAKVLEPDYLIDEIKGKIQGMQEMYEE